MPEQCWKRSLLVELESLSNWYLKVVCYYLLCCTKSLYPYKHCSSAHLDNVLSTWHNLESPKKGVSVEGLTCGHVCGSGLNWWLMQEDPGPATGSSIVSWENGYGLYKEANYGLSVREEANKQPSSRVSVLSSCLSSHPDFLQCWTETWTCKPSMPFPLLSCFQPVFCYKREGNQNRWQIKETITWTEQKTPGRSAMTLAIRDAQIRSHPRQDNYH